MNHDPSLGRVSSVIKVVILDRGGGCVNALALLEREWAIAGDTCKTLLEREWAIAGDTYVQDAPP